MDVIDVPVGIGKHFRVVRNVTVAGVDAMTSGAAEGGASPFSAKSSVKNEVMV